MTAKKTSKVSSAGCTSARTRLAPAARGRDKVIRPGGVADGGRGGAEALRMRRWMRVLQVGGRWAAPAACAEFLRSATKRRVVCVCVAVCMCVW